MSGRELIPPGRDEDGTTALPVLPGTVAAAHLAACAAGLVEDTAAGRIDGCVRDFAELAELVDRLVAGQRHLAIALTQVADRLPDRSPDVVPRDAARSAQLAALAEVLRAAATATGYAADALAESGPVIELVRDDDDFAC